jgi:hypothetical protein
MSWREDYVTQNYISREVLQIVNEHGDEIELETIQFDDHYRAIATICQDQTPSKDYIGFGHDTVSERNAIEEALRELYQNTYNYENIFSKLLIPTTKNNTNLIN